MTKTTNTTERDFALDKVWSFTPHDYRHSIQGVRYVLVNRSGPCLVGPCLVPLDDLTDEEIKRVWRSYRPS